MTRIAAFIGAALIALSTIAAQAAEVLNGTYFGIEDAQGATIRIEPDSGGFTGVFFDPLGASQTFKADRTGEIAEAVLDMDNRTILMRMVALPYGAEVAIIPFDGNGNLILESARLLNFIREGMTLPQKPRDFVDAPTARGDTVAANSFLASYQFWNPVGVVNGYLGLPDRFYPLMRMFPAVQLDVIWKLCLAPEQAANAALATAMRGQGVTCESVREGIANAQRTSRFDAYKQEVSNENRILRMVVRCGEGYVESKADCDIASKKLSLAAVALRTAQNVLARYR